MPDNVASVVPTDGYSYQTWKGYTPGARVVRVFISEAHPLQAPRATPPSAFRHLKACQQCCDCKFREAIAWGALGSEWEGAAHGHERLRAGWHFGCHPHCRITVLQDLGSQRDQARPRQEVLARAKKAPPRVWSRPAAADRARRFAFQHFRPSCRGAVQAPQKASGPGGLGGSTRLGRVSACVISAVRSSVLAGPRACCQRCTRTTTACTA